jgi:hypothetical protein
VGVDLGRPSANEASVLVGKKTGTEEKNEVGEPVTSVRFSGALVPFCQDGQAGGRAK